MPPPQKSQEELVLMELTVAVPNRLLSPPIVLGLLIAYLARVLLQSYLPFCLMIAIDSDLMISHQVILEPSPNSYSSRLHLL